MTPPHLDPTNLAVKTDLVATNLAVKKAAILAAPNLAVKMAAILVAPNQVVKMAAILAALNLVVKMAAMNLAATNLVVKMMTTADELRFLLLMSLLTGKRRAMVSAE